MVLEIRGNTFFAQKIYFRASLLLILYFGLRYYQLTVCKEEEKSIVSQVKCVIADWRRYNPEPVIPTLREFHDPTAELTDRDRKIILIFDYWPGYPPFWDYLRMVVLKRDNNRCQVTGCPSRTNLHIHHQQSIYHGGSHRPDNLITLCIFHHALQPQVGHSLMKSEVQTKYFTIVCAHLRKGYPVKAHYRRKELIDMKSLCEITEYHRLVCPTCRGQVDYIINNFDNKVIIRCCKCCIEWELEQKLAEETGPQIASILLPQHNVGKGRIDIKKLISIKLPITRRF